MTAPPCGCCKSGRVEPWTNYIEFVVLPALIDLALDLGVIDGES
jgi:hypothetical protein